MGGFVYLPHTNIMQDCKSKGYKLNYSNTSVMLVCLIIMECGFCSQIVLQWDEKEVKSALQDKNLLAAVLMDKGVAA